MVTSDLVAWVALSLIDHLGSQKITALKAHFGSLSAVILASASELRAVRGIGEKLSASITQINLEKTERSLRQWVAKHVQIIPLTSQDYPPHLRRISDPPATLFALGNKKLLKQQKAVAIVGTRQPTPDIKTRVMALSTQLVEREIIVVSGLALGVDAAAHLGALSLPTSQTIAVLGSGVLNLYPSEHQALGQAVIDRGLLLSEVHPEARAKATSLVARNRLISGLSKAVVIAQTEVDGGAMHAARRAIAQNVPVFVFDIPASGNQALLSDGAIPLAESPPLAVTQIETYFL